MASHLLPPGCDDILPDGVHALTSASSKEFSMIKDIDGLNPKSLSKALKDVSKTMVPSLVTDDTKKEAAAASGHVPLKLVQPKMKCERPKGLDKKSDPTDMFASLWSDSDDSTSECPEGSNPGNGVIKKNKAKGNQKPKPKPRANPKSTRANAKVNANAKEFRARQTQQAAIRSGSLLITDGNDRVFPKVSRSFDAKLASLPSKNYLWSAIWCQNRQPDQSYQPDQSACEHLRVFSCVGHVGPNDGVKITCHPDADPTRPTSYLMPSFDPATAV